MAEKQLILTHLSNFHTNTVGKTSEYWTEENSSSLAL